MDLERHKKKFFYAATRTRNATRKKKQEQETRLAWAERRRPAARSGRQRATRCTREKDSVACNDGGGEIGGRRREGWKHGRHQAQTIGAQLTKMFQAQADCTLSHNIIIYLFLELYYYKFVFIVR